MFKNDMVTLEACRVLVDLGYLTPKEYTPCVTGALLTSRCENLLMRF